MRALITGASGFVGGAVLRRLHLEGVQVRVLARPQADDSNWAGLPNIEVVEGDLRDPASLQRAVTDCRWVFHVAADYRLWVPDPDAMYQANVAGTEALIRAAQGAGVERIVYTSSVAVLGFRADGQPSDEETPSSLMDMIGHYKRSKFLAEERVRALCREEGAPVVIVNPSMPIGPGDRKPTPTGRMIVEAAAGRMPAFIDTGLNVVHVDDVAMGHWLALQQGRVGERYILGGDNLSLQAILTRISGLTGRPSPRLRLPRRLLFPVAWLAESWVRWRGRGVPLVTRDELRMAAHRMYFDSRKAEQELGYTHRPAEEALRDAVAWFSQHQYY